MARSDVLLEGLISYYSRLGMDALAILRKTREEMRTEGLDYGRLAGRAVDWWADACEGWWSAMLASGTPPLPTLFLACRSDSTAHSNSIRMPVPGNSQPAITDLFRVGTTDRLAARVSVTVTHFRDQLTVALSDMKKPTPGTYQAIVHLDELPLALVVIQIQAVAASDPPSS